MSDLRIRELERRISGGDEDAKIALSRHLQRTGQRGDYYARQFVDAFWDKFSMESFYSFDDEGHILRVYYVDPLNASQYGASATAKVYPGMVGEPPRIKLRAMLHNRVIAQALAPPGDDDLKRSLEMDIGSIASVWPQGAIVLHDSYMQWVQERAPSTDSFTDAIARSISQQLHRGFVEIWNDLEEECANLVSSRSYIRPNPDDSLRQLERSYASEPSGETLQKLNRARQRVGEEIYFPPKHLEWLVWQIREITGARLIPPSGVGELLRLANGNYKDYHITVVAHNLFDYGRYYDYTNAHITVHAEHPDLVYAPYVEIYPDDSIYIRQPTGGPVPYNYYTIDQNQPWVYDARSLLDFLISLY